MTIRQGADAPARIAGQDWWHTIEVAPGVLTPGSWDLREAAGRMPWPASLAGLRCLDVGTMDGFWAFELERRGAGEVVASDVAEAGAARERFRLAAELLGSGAEYRELDVYHLEPERIGEFDLVFMGYVLQMLRDPLRGLEAVRRVCRGWLILLETVSAPLSLLPAPLARLDARRGHTELFVFNRRGLTKVATLAGFTVEEVTPIFRDRAGHGVDPSELPPAVRAKHAIGILGRSLALRARAS
jgi:tRNA (mo5U34)-methyltransferase